MLDDETLDKLMAEVYSRLCMTDEEFEYEIDVPGHKACLGIAGGAKQREFFLTPVLLGKLGHRKERPRKFFTHRIEGTITIAGKERPNIKVFAVEPPGVGLADWLRSDPWST